MIKLTDLIKEATGNPTKIEIPEIGHVTLSTTTPQAEGINTKEAEVKANETIGKLEDLYVNPEHRAKPERYGQQLLIKAIKQAEKQGITTLFARVEPKKTGRDKKPTLGLPFLIRLFRNVGFYSLQSGASETQTPMIRKSEEAKRMKKIDAAKGSFGNPTSKEKRKDRW